MEEFTLRAARGWQWRWAVTRAPAFAFLTWPAWFTLVDSVQLGYIDSGHVIVFAMTSTPWGLYGGVWWYGARRAGRTDYVFNAARVVVLRRGQEIRRIATSEIALVDASGLRSWSGIPGISFFVPPFPRLSLKLKVGSDAKLPRLTSTSPLDTLENLNHIKTATGVRVCYYGDFGELLWA
jgi:hypothetical protein